MSTDNSSKINKLLASVPAGAVLQSSWLVEQGYSLDLQKRYRHSNWLKSIGNGAMVRTKDQVDYEGGVYAMQHQSAMSVHIGGRTALSQLGLLHYLELNQSRVTLFGAKNETLPTWFKNWKWAVKIEYYRTAFLPADEGLTTIKINALNLKISNALRAILECLYLAPQKQELMECFEIMEGLNNFHPLQVQSLLEKCTSVKVKRLFLYLAEKAGHSWFNKLDLNKIDLGSGKRSIVKDGVYIKKYLMTVPKELEKNDSPKI
ncbi:MAG TPA: type IV toxin-antitoxin system AbiEi family antitoxin [Sediminibacterium sp.]|nr:type IV toxin-antitoxin system AbiEi family antitoxin [Sediminibacterium sp.]